MIHVDFNKKICAVDHSNFGVTLAEIDMALMLMWKVDGDKALLTFFDMMLGDWGKRGLECTQEMEDFRAAARKIILAMQIREAIKERMDE